MCVRKREGFLAIAATKREDIYEVKERRRRSGSHFEIWCPKLKLEMNRFCQRGGNFVGGGRGRERGEGRRC